MPIPTTAMIQPLSFQNELRLLSLDPQIANQGKQNPKHLWSLCGPSQLLPVRWLLRFLAYVDEAGSAQPLAAFQGASVTIRDRNLWRVEKSASTSHAAPQTNMPIRINHSRQPRQIGVGCHTRYSTSIRRRVTIKHAFLDPGTSTHHGGPRHPGPRPLARPRVEPDLGPVHGSLRVRGRWLMS